MKHLRLESNKTGRDLIVGDLHGCYDDLMFALKELDFDFKNDRLFSVGDVIDRGPNSIKCLNLIYEPWFKMVLGNHEHMMMDSLVNNNGLSFQCWVQNGGIWHFTESDDDVRSLAADLNNLPYVITVGNYFHIVHAELTKTVFNVESYHNDVIPVSDQTLFHWDFSEDDEMNMLWERRMIMTGYNTPEKMKLFQSDLSLTFCGHSQVSEVVKLGSQIYIDTGAYEYHTKDFDSKMTFAEPNKKLIHQYSMSTGEVSSFSFDKIKNYSEKTCI
jgi:serine/threonine protein phosphatase 1